MDYTMEEKYSLIKKELLQMDDIDPIVIARTIMKEEYISIHGPEHHFLDGAALMTAMKNAGLDIDLETSLDKLAQRTIKMPGAMCGYWGICGSVASMGAVFSIVDGTGPLSDSPDYSSHMSFTSEVINVMSMIGGPRCCKRNAFLSIKQAIQYANKRYGLKMPLSQTICEFSDLNNQCIKERCPFHK